MLSPEGHPGGRRFAVPGCCLRRGVRGRCRARAARKVAPLCLQSRAGPDGAPDPRSPGGRGRSPRRPGPQPAPAPPGRHRPAGSRGGLPQRSARARPFFNFYYRCILNPPRFRLAESSQLKAPEPRPPEPGAAPLPAAVGEHRPPSTRAASPRYVIMVPCTPVSARQPDVRSSESRLKAGFSKRKGSTQQQLSPFPGN